jgi:OmpA-OmpF porin, OOP family
MTMIKKPLLIFIALIFIPSFAFSNANDSTILAIRIFDAKNHDPITAKVTIFLNSDFLVHDSLTTQTGDFAKVLKEEGFYIIEIYSENHVISHDTLWHLGGPNQIIERKYYVTPIEPGHAVSINDVQFYFNSNYLKADSEHVLDTIVDFLNTHPGISVEIGGHTDDEGDAVYNMYLSESRAKSIQNYLTRKGITRSRLIAKGYGETKPVDRGITKAAKARNRRVEFIVTEISGQQTIKEDLP